DVIGVTPATLQVTCSKLGISLRQPRFNTGTGMVRTSRARTRSRPENAAISHSTDLAQSAKGETDKPPGEKALVKEGNAPAKVHHPGREAKDRSEPGKFTITMHYKGQQRTSEIALSPETIARLGLEAEFRGLRMAELLSQVLAAVIEND